MKSGNVYASCRPLLILVIGSLMLQDVNAQGATSSASGTTTTTTTRGPLEQISTTTTLSPFSNSTTTNGTDPFYDCNPELADCKTYYDYNTKRLVNDTQNYFSCVNQTKCAYGTDGYKRREELMTDLSTRLRTAPHQGYESGGNSALCMYPSAAGLIVPLFLLVALLSNVGWIYDGPRPARHCRDSLST